MIGSNDQFCQLDGNQSCSSIDNSIASTKTDSEIDSEQDNIPLIGSHDQICQVDGNQSCSSIDNSIASIDTDSEIDSEPLRAVLDPAQQQPGQPFALDVDNSDKLEAPSSLPLTMVANLRSAYNKVNNLRTNLNTLGLDLLVASESWERPRMPLEELLGSPHFSVISYCRGGEPPATRKDGRHNGKLYPAKTGGGAAIIFNKHRFQVIDKEVGVPAGLEVVWGVLAPRRLDDKLQQVRRICVGSIYIAPRSPYKT